MSTKKKEIHDMTVVELLNHFNESYDKDGDPTEDHEATLETILNTWPFSEFAELEGRIEKLETDIHQMKKHTHLPNGKPAVPIEF